MLRLTHGRYHGTGYDTDYIYNLRDGKDFSFLLCETKKHLTI